MPNFGYHVGEPRRHRERTETTEQRNTRLARERALLDEARAEFEQGVTMDEDEVEAWLDALDGDEDRPLPEMRRPGPTRGM